MKNVNCSPAPLVCEPILVEGHSPYPIRGDSTIDSNSCPYCKNVFTRVDNLKRHVAKCQVVNNLRGNNITNLTTNHHNTLNSNNDNSTNITINNAIHINSFDKPSVDHVNKEVVKELYYKAGRNLKKLIHEGVRKIWEREENNSFKLPFSTTRKKISDSLFRNNETLEVYSNGTHRMLPANHVVDVVLQKSAEVCESYLRQHHYDDDVPGVAVLKHADVLEGLAIGYQETWDEDKRFRDGYKPFVQSALIECMLLSMNR